MMSGCKGELVIHKCYFCGSQDDSCNIHGTHLRIVETNDTEQKIRVRFMERRSFGFEVFEVGDKVELVHASNLKSYQQNCIKEIRTLDKWNMELTLAEPLPKEILINEDVVENISWTPNVVYRNNISEYIPTRAVLCTTRGKVLIEDNIWNGFRRPAVLIEDDAHGWFESGPVRNMTIRNNKFKHCIAPQIYVNPQTQAADDPCQTVHSNIMVEDNHFMTEESVELKMSSTKNIKVINNIFPETGGTVTFIGCDECFVFGNKNHISTNMINSVSGCLK